LPQKNSHPNISDVIVNPLQLNPSLILKIFLCLICIDLVLAILHLIFPEYYWGQGRGSYFNFENQLTLANWFSSMQFFIAALVALLCLLNSPKGEKTIWALTSLLLIFISVADITLLTNKLIIATSSYPDIYPKLWLMSLLGLFLILHFRIFHRHFQNAPKPRLINIIWLITAIVFMCASIATENSYTIFITGISKLLLASFSIYLLLSYSQQINNPIAESSTQPRTAWLYAGISITTFIAINFQILTFQTVTYFNGYNTANTIISIALLGISLGALVAYLCNEAKRQNILFTFSLLLPVTVLFSFFSIINLNHLQWVMQLILILPFFITGTVITLGLLYAHSSRIYFFDLLGAAIGAVLINILLLWLREEGTYLLLAGLGFLATCCFYMSTSIAKTRLNAALILSFFTICSISLAHNNISQNWLNITAANIHSQYPNNEILHSTSSLIGRYDIIKRDPQSRVLKSMENGNTIDTIRRNTYNQYQIDPRLPHNLHTKPDILIIGVSGDGITKTSRLIGNKVDGVEINPAIIDLMQNKLKPYNGNNYEGISVAAMDGRSYLEQTDKKYDVITLMNAHFAKGSTKKRSGSPEYLHTLEAYEQYLEHLNPDGYINIESVLNRPNTIPSIVKATITLREALINKGITVTNTGKHFFIFRWRTRRGNYIQTLVKNTPFTKQDVVKLKQWLKKVDNLAIRGSSKEWGPIRTAKTTLLHNPLNPSESNYSLAAQGKISEIILESHRLEPALDNKPFPFDTDPSHKNLTLDYLSIVFACLIFLPFLIHIKKKNPQFKLHTWIKTNNQVLLIVALTGSAYFFIEMVFIQQLSIFLTTPVIALTTVLGTLLLFSGLGSLYSSNISQKNVFIAIFISIILLVFWMAFSSLVTTALASVPITIKVFLCVVFLAPLGFILGLPFPYLMRHVQSDSNLTSPAILFAFNGVFAAIAIPLSINLSTSWGFNFTLFISICFYLLVLLLFLHLHNQKIKSTITLFSSCFLLLILSLPIAQSAYVLLLPPASSTFTVTAIEYGKSNYRQSLAMENGDKNRFIPFSWYVWLVQNEQRNILVDTGFESKERARNRRFAFYQSPSQTLNQLGLTANDITDVIISHSHWDHIGGLHKYPNARIWMTQEAYEKIKSDTTKHKMTFVQKTATQAFEALNKAKSEKRLIMIDQEIEILPGLELIPASGHTLGSLFTKVATIDGNTILASDNAYLYRSIERHLIPGSSVAKSSNRHAIKQMHQMASDPLFIIPGHDPLVKQYYPKLSDHIYDISSKPK